MLAEPRVHVAELVAVNVETYELEANAAMTAKCRYHHWLSRSFGQFYMTYQPSQRYNHHDHEGKPDGEVTSELRISDRCIAIISLSQDQLARALSLFLRAPGQGFRKVLSAGIWGRIAVTLTNLSSST